jgi:hypothetical protein
MFSNQINITPWDEFLSPADGRKSMTTPAQYHHQLTELSETTFSTDDLTPAKAKASLAKLAEQIQNAQEVERALNLDMQVIRTQFRSRAAAASSGLSSRIMVSNRNRPGSKDRAGEVDQINSERDAKLAPYEEVKKQVEEYLASLDVTRQKLEEQAGKQAKAPKKEKE